MIRVRHINVDLDGVLADCNGHYAKHFGVTLPANGHPIEDNIFWGTVMRYPGDPGQFFLDLPLCVGARELVDSLIRLGEDYNVRVLTGCPAHRPYVAEAKRLWVGRHFGTGIEVVTCPSSDKYLHGQPGDILIDDWVKWRDRWEGMGGVFILHENTCKTLAELQRHLP